MTNKEKLKSCPVFKLKQWWWKKYFNYYHKQQRSINNIFRHEWVNGGYESHKEILNIMIDKMFLDQCPPLTLTNKVK